MTAATFAIIGTAASLVGGGIAAYSSYQAGKTNAAISSFNAMNQEKNAKMQLLAMQTQANLQKQAAEAQYALRSQEAQAKFNNATSIENQALGQDRINRVNLQKRREEMERQAASTRAAIAASGAVESSGTPLDILAETAATIQRDQEEQHYEGELNRISLLREAQMERLGGSLALAGATLDRNSEVAAAGLNRSAARSSYLSGMREANLTRLSGKSAARSGAIQAGATLFSSIGSAASGYQTYKTS
jgi:predicted PP-loop superfamily ATPase